MFLLVELTVLLDDLIINDYEANCAESDCQEDQRENARDYHAYFLPSRILRTCKIYSDHCGTVLITVDITGNNSRPGKRKILNSILSEIYKFLPTSVCTLILAN